LFGAPIWLVSAYSVFTIALPWRPAFVPIFYTAGSTIVLAGVLTFHRMKTTVNPLTTHTESDHDDGHLGHLQRHP
jgi:hypothetical protein